MLVWAAPGRHALTAADCWMPRRDSGLRLAVCALVLIATELILLPARWDTRLRHDGTGMWTVLLCSPSQPP